MKLYFAGPLFTPYVRKFIEEKARILREQGFEVFVPHENFPIKLSQEQVEKLVKDGVISLDISGKMPTPEEVSGMVQAGLVSREALSLPPLTSKQIFEKDYEGLSTADAVVAILDGTQVDDGTACEIGIFYGLTLKNPGKKGIVGYTSDMRGVRKAKAGFGVNFFVLGVIEECGKVTTDFDEVIAQLKEWETR